MKSAFRRFAVLVIILIATGCSVAPGTVQPPDGRAVEEGSDWVKIPISQVFEGRTVSVEVEEDVYFFHGNKLSIYDPGSDSWDHRPEENPYLVDEMFSATFDGHGSVYILTGKTAGFYVFDIKQNKYTELAAMPSPIAIGVRMVSDGDRYIYAATGINSKAIEQNILYRYDISSEEWESLGKIKSVNMLGRYSSGLSFWEGTLYAWGDHHVSYFDPITKQWGKEIYYPMRYRPALGNGGMYTVDQKAGLIFVTLGQESNSLGVLTLATKGFYYLSPRLPFLLGDGDDTLFLTEVNQQQRLNVLSGNQKAIYSIELGALNRIDNKVDNSAADIGSSWKIHNIGARGAGGELIRHTDSFTNMIFAPPYVYNHRKNILRRFDLSSGWFSWVGGCCGPHGAEFKFHKKFITSGAGSAFDAKRYIYLYSGHDQQFFRVDLWGGKVPTNEEELKNPQAAAEDMLVEMLAELPEQPSSNTAITYHDGAVWAVFDPEKRNLYRYDVSDNTWVKVVGLPDNAVYDTKHGFVLASSGKQLFLFAKDTLYAYDNSGGWEAGRSFGFSFYEDGGMVAFDSNSNKFFVAVGNSTTSLGVVYPGEGESGLLAIEFPDVVSVAGQRMFINAGELYIGRGHNSAEIWRIPVEELR
jgi:hypothetical protein